MLRSRLPAGAQVLLIGDPHQLPSVGPGRVLADLLASRSMPRFELQQVFRQAQTSAIVTHAHAIRRGEVPDLPSPVRDPTVWARGEACLFLDSDVASQEEIRFVRRAKAVMAQLQRQGGQADILSEEARVGTLQASVTVSGSLEQRPVEQRRVEQRRVEQRPAEQRPVEPEGTLAQPTVFSVPRRFLHVDLPALARTQGGAEELEAVLRRVHPGSTLHHGLTTSWACSTATSGTWLR